MSELASEPTELSELASEPTELSELASEPWESIAGRSAGVSDTEAKPELAPMSSPRPRSSRLGVCLGVDVGSVRVGVAVSDPDGRFAVPLTTLARDHGAAGSDVADLAALVADRGATHVVVGLPRSLSGQIGPAAAAARRYADAVAHAVTPVPVHEFDERLTTASVSRSLSRSGISTRRQRPVLDQAAAALILQGWLDQTRRTELTDPSDVGTGTSR